MPITTITAALSQFNSYPPSTWGDSGAAALCLDAIYFLLAQRASDLEDQGSIMRFESLDGIRKTLETRLGLAGVRANGRSRSVYAQFNEGSPK